MRIDLHWKYQQEILYKTTTRRRTQFKEIIPMSSNLTNLKRTIATSIPLLFVTVDRHKKHDGSNE
jgi:hypothetical protein